MPVFNINTMLFPEGKRKALTLSYDDGATQDRRLVDLLNRYGVKGTFNINSGRLGKSKRVEKNGKALDVCCVEEEEIGMLYEGHEVATHAVNHAALTVRGSAALTEIVEDRKKLEELVLHLVLGHAYPYGLYDRNTVLILQTAGIQYARTTISTEKFELPDNFLEWHPTCHHGNPRLMELIKQFCEQEHAYGQAQLFYLWGHSFEFDFYENWNVLQDFLEYVSAFDEELWKATNIQIAEYVAAFKRLVFSADGMRAYNPSSIDVWIESTGKIYRIPSGTMVRFSKREFS